MIMKDNQFNRFFCEKWPIVKPFLETWQTIAKKFWVKRALSILIDAGNKKYAECSDIGK